MRRYFFHPHDVSADDASWMIAWLERAADKTAKAVDDAKSGTVSWMPGVWRDLRDWLLAKVFAGKCAYCEGPLTAQSYGAAEHYRPKGRVTQRNGRRVELVMNEDQPHRGYYWLAYAWFNIVPSCDKCNSGGKGDEFPVAARRVFSPDELHDTADPSELDAIEKPLLLHPYFDDPSQHLVFGVAGTIAARQGSERGRTTIEVCNLDRGSLREERARQQEIARTAILKVIAEAVLAEQPIKPKVEKAAGRLVNVRGRYSAAARVAVDQTVAGIAHDLGEVGSTDT